MEPDYWGPGTLTQGTNPPVPWFLLHCVVYETEQKCDGYLLGDGPTY